MHFNICKTSELCRTVKTGIQISTSQNFCNEEPPKLEIMTITYTPILPVISNSTFDTQTWIKCKHENIFESRFNNTSYSSTTMPNLSLNTSSVCLPLPLETGDNILLGCSLISEKPLQVLYSYDTMMLLKVLFLKILIDLSQKK